MIKTEYTPGPWHLGKPDHKGEDAHMCEVMTAYTTKNENGTVGCYDLVCRTWSPTHMAASVRLSRKECMANARLIAAAPELLEALKVAKMHLGHMAAFITSKGTGYSFEGLGEDMPGIDAAIAKAETL